MTRDEMWAMVNDWRTPPEEKKRLLQILHTGPQKGVDSIRAGGCASCKKRLR